MDKIQKTDLGSHWVDLGLPENKNAPSSEIAQEILFEKEEKLENLEKALKFFEKGEKASLEKNEKKLEKAEIARTIIEKLIELSPKALKPLVAELKKDDKQGWKKALDKVSSKNIARLGKLAENAEILSEMLEVPFILAVDLPAMFATWKKAQQQADIVISLEEQVKTLEDIDSNDPRITELRVKLVEEQEKLQELKNDIAPEKLVSLLATLLGAAINRGVYIWELIEKDIEAGNAILGLTTEQAHQALLGFKGAAAGLKLVLGLRKAYKIIKDDIIPLRQEIKVVNDKIKTLEKGSRLRQELKIRKVFLERGKTWEIIKKSFFTLVDILGAGAGVAQFVAVTVLGITVAATPLFWIGIALMALPLVVKGALYIYEESPLFEAWLARRPLENRIKEINKALTQEKINEKINAYENAKNTLIQAINNDNYQNIDEYLTILGIDQNKWFGSEKQLLEIVNNALKTKIESLTSKNEERQQLIAQVEAIKNIAKARVFCRKKRMDYENWREIVIKIQKSMENEEIKKERRAHLQELYENTKDHKDCNRYSRYVHYFDKDPTKAWLAYLTNEEFGKLEFHDPKEVESDRLLQGIEVKPYARANKFLNKAIDVQNKILEKEKKNALEKQVIVEKKVLIEEEIELNN